MKLSFLEGKVLDYLAENKSITVQECIKKIGTTELRKIISNLKEKGFIICDIWEKGVNRYGDSTRYKRYFILKGSKND